MIEKKLQEILKKYVSIFMNEYSSFLSKEQLDKLNNINIDKTIVLENVPVAFGEVNLGRIYLSNNIELFDNIHKMKEFNTRKYDLNNKNLSSYIKYMCDNGYDIERYYSDILMYFIFKLVIKNSSFLNNGFINQEIRYLSIKYSLNCANLYAREEALVEKITRIIKLDNIRQVLFVDKITRFKYLCENLGYRYAELVEKVEDIVENEYSKIENINCVNLNGLLDYVNNYDKLSYGEAYNCILDFEVLNNYLI